MTQNDTPAPARQAGSGAADPSAAGSGAVRQDAPQASSGPLCTTYDAALLDLDGVVYLGGKAIPGAAEALGEAARAGMRLAYVTNNASRSPSAIAHQLTSLGVTASPADIVTSAQAAARLLAERLPAGSPVLVAGGIGLRIALRERSLRPVSAAAERPVAVVQGFAPGISYSMLAEAALAIRAGAWYVASNADATLPSPRGLEPGNGSIIALLATATGQQPDVAGKPEPPLHAEAVQRTGAARPLVVGDRLDTDIEGAVRARTDSLLVLTGVTSPAGALLAPPGQRPAYLAADLGGLLTAHPGVTREEGAFSCGGWTARRDEATGKLSLSGSGDPLDGLRALCGAAWSGPAPLTPEQAADAVQGLDLPS